MKYRKRPEAGNVPPFVDPLFASELESGRPGRSRDRSRQSAAQGGRDDRKTKQLCRQAYQALSLALAGECDDEVLRDLTIESVVPAPNASRLLVTVALPPALPGEPAPSPQEVMGRLAQAQGRLRRSLAAAVTRKRAPELTFLPVAPQVASFSPPAPLLPRRSGDEGEAVRHD